MRATIASVVERNLGTEIDGDHASGVSTLTVVLPEEMDWDGSSTTTLQIGDETHDYTMDEATGNVLLADTLVASYVDGERVYIYPLSPERVAYVIAPDQEEQLEARVPLSMYDRVPVGIRSEGESVEVEFSGPELVLTDVIAQAPLIDGGFLNTQSNDTPIVTGGTATMDGTYHATDGAVTIEAEADSTALVNWSVNLLIENDGSGNTLNVTAFASLLVNGVQTGSEPQVTEFYKTDPTGPTPLVARSLHGATPISMVAGESYTLEVGIKGSAAATTEVSVNGSKRGGISYLIVGS